MCLVVSCSTLDSIYLSLANDELYKLKGVFFFLPVGIGLSGIVLNDLAKGKVSGKLHSLFLHLIYHTGKMLP